MDQLTPYQRWYRNNRETFNEARRDRYARDPNVREQAVQRQRDYRANKATQPKERNHFRDHNGQKVQVWRIGHVAERLEVDRQTIRKWEEGGWIPPASIGSTHRYYTERQIKLMEAWKNLMAEVRYKPSVRKPSMEALSSLIKKNWNK